MLKKRKMAQKVAENHKSAKNTKKRSKNDPENSEKKLSGSFFEVETSAIPL